MSDGSSIEWCDATWQPVVGCTRVSAGCDNCYAIGTVNRFRKADGLTKLRPKDAARAGLDWSGKVQLQPEHLADPFGWKPVRLYDGPRVRGVRRRCIGTRSRRIFVCSQADLFHDQVPFEFIAAVFGVMAACPQHTFLVLTKRPARAREFFAWLIDQACTDIGPMLCSWCIERAGFTLGDDAFAPGIGLSWPLPNVHLGVSVEDQATADERIPALLQCPAALRWVSYEPALGPVDFDAIQIPDERSGLRFSALRSQHDDRFGSTDTLVEWIVVGGESGPRAREFQIEWARGTVRSCRAAGKPVFVKQLGSKPRQPASDVEAGGLGTWTLELEDYSGGDIDEWPADLRVRELPTR